MQEFLDIVLSFPTVIFSVLMCVTMIFSLLIVLTGVGGDWLSVDMDIDIDAGGLEEAGASLEVLSFLGIGKVPMTIWAGVFVLWGWLISFFSVFFLQDITAINTFVGSLILAMTVVFALPLTAFVTYPIRFLFVGDSGSETGDALLGAECIITTNRVDENFGQARCRVDGVEIVLSVRCHIDNDLSRGDRAYIIEYDGENNRYRVKSHDDFFGAENPDGDARFDFDPTRQETSDEDVEGREEIKQQKVSQTQ